MWSPADREWEQIDSMANGADLGREPDYGPVFEDRD